MPDAGFKLTVEGEKEFRKAISDVNAILKLNQAELQRVTAEYNASDKSLKAMTERQEELGEVIDRQTAVVEQMEKELSRLTEEYGENATGTVKMQAETEKARATLANLNAQFKENAAEMEAAAEASEEYGSSMEEIDARIAEAEAEIKAMDAAMQSGAKTMGVFSGAAEDAEKRISDLQRQNEKLNDEVAMQETRMHMLNEELEKAERLYGTGSAEVERYKMEIESTGAEIEQLRGKIEDNNEAIEEAKNPATDLKDVFSQIGEITGVEIPEGLAAIVGGVGGVTAAAGMAVTAVAGIAKEVAGAAKEAQNFSAEIRKLSNQSGLTTQQVQELQYVSSMLGVDYESIADTMKDLTEKMYDASSGNAELSAEFNDLGVRIYDTNGNLRQSFDVLIELIDAYGDISNKTERAARMQKILGESSRELNALIYAGGTAIKQYRDQAHEWGIVMSEEVATAMEVTEKKTRELDAAWSAFWRNLGANAQLSWNALKQGDLEGAFSYETPWAQSQIKAGNKWFELFLQKLAGNYVEPVASTPYTEPKTEYVYNITVTADDAKTFSDIVNKVESERITERMK